jgi:protein-disulfide isomerase
MHDQLLEHQGALTAKDLIRYAAELGLDIEQFTRDLRNHAGEAKIAADVNSADLSGVSGTPAFFINSKRHHGAYDISTLSNAVRAARARTLITSHGQPRRASRSARSGRPAP